MVWYFFKGFPMNFKRTKRIFDLGAAAILMVVASPLFVVIALFILFKGGSPVFFWQWRPGIKGQPFIMYKFRTMVGRGNSPNKLSVDAQPFDLLGANIKRNEP